MTLGNLPKPGALPIEGKRYWRLAIGRDASPSRFFEGGWRAFEFTIFKKYKGQQPGAAYPYVFRLAFAYWLPFYSI